MSSAFAYLSALAEHLRNHFAVKNSEATGTTAAEHDLIEPGNRERLEVIRAAQAFRPSPLDSRRTPRPSRSHRLA